MRTRRRIASMVALVTGLPLLAIAGNGQIEINQTCAIQTGCSTGDAPGFPVDITEPGSYVLTSDLNHNPATHGTTAIVRLLADDVSLDLNGFTIRSTSTCQSGSCDIGSVHGIDSSIADRASIRNGRIVGVDGVCIRVASEANIEDVIVSHCGSLGISVGGNSIVQDCRVTSTGRTGLHSSAISIPPIAPGTLYRNCTFARNGLRGETLLPDMSASVARTLKATGPNFCDDQLCGSGKRRFYLTPTLHTSDQVLGACDTGFHVAGLWEIFEVSELEYDTRRGPFGPTSKEFPGSQGWVRISIPFSPLLPNAGLSDCQGWTSTSSSERGTAVGFSGPVPLDADAQVSSPWAAVAFVCSALANVWCVED